MTMTGNWRDRLRLYLVQHHEHHASLAKAKDCVWGRFGFSNFEMEQAELKLVEAGYIKYCEHDTHSGKQGRKVCVIILKKGMDFNGD